MPLKTIHKFPRFEDDPALRARRQTTADGTRADTRIGIFAGTGSSHSWLWFVDTFERMGFLNLRLLDVSDIDRGGLIDCDVLAVSGGDTFAIAEGLGPSGARQIRRFIEAGGLYIGSCAGAYLVMNSSKPHLNRFNFAAVKITNLNKTLPECRRMPHKFSVCYGCRYIFHPVRGAVELELTGSGPFGQKGERLYAPLYGGPGMTVSGDGQILARYAGFTAKTQHLVDRDIARNTLVGNAAAVRVFLGDGSLYLFGPHFEHPHYRSANELVARAIFSDAPRRDTDHRPYAPQKQTGDESMPGHTSWIRDLKRGLSNSRIVATGLEMRPVRWRIGSKFYEPEKIRVFIESMWKRLKRWEKDGAPGCPAASAAQLVRCTEETTTLLRRLKRELDAGTDTQPLAEALFDRLHHLSKTFLGAYFRALNAAAKPFADESGQPASREAPGRDARPPRCTAIRSM